MFEKFYEILKDLLPSRDLPTPVWVVRLISVASISLIFVLVLNFILQGTPLGDRLGINKPIPILPTLSQTELVYGNRETWNELSKYRDLDPDEIQSTFLVFIARKKDGNVVTQSTSNDKRVYPLIWVWNIPSTGHNISLRLVEDSFSPQLEKYRALFSDQKKKESRYCFFNKIQPSSLSVLKRAIVGFDADYAVSCALYDNNEIAIGATIAYIKLKTTLSKELDELSLYSLMDKLRNTTDTIEPKYNNMSVQYQLLYNSRP